MKQIMHVWKVNLYVVLAYSYTHKACVTLAFKVIISFVEVDGSILILTHIGSHSGSFSGSFQVLALLLRSFESLYLYCIF